MFVSRGLGLAVLPHFALAREERSRELAVLRIDSAALSTSHLALCSRREGHLARPLKLLDYTCWNRCPFSLHRVPWASSTLTCCLSRNEHFEKLGFFRLRSAAKLCCLESYRREFVGSRRLSRHLRTIHMSPACPHVALAEPNYVDVAIGRLREARRAVARHIRPTPLVPGDGLISRGGNPILLKAENLQPSGSFKIRGALHVISGLSADQCKRGVIAYSTGNHAQAVAIAARKFGTTATIVMSPDAPPAKIARTRKLGAEVIMAEPTSLARRLLAEALSHERELTLVPPYDHPGVIVGRARSHSNSSIKARLGQLPCFYRSAEEASSPALPHA